MTEEREEMLKNMEEKELEDYVFKKKYTQNIMDYYLDIIKEKNNLVEELYGICDRQNKYIKDISDLKNLADGINISVAKVELINKKLQQLANEIR